MRTALTQLLAAAQLAEMAYNADPVEHKREAWQKAQTEYELAAEAERLEQLALAGQPAPLPDGRADGMLQEIQELTNVKAILEQKNQILFNDKLALAEANARLENENTLLKGQLIEKGQKIDELQKLAPAGAPVSGKEPAGAVPAVVETPAPVATPTVTSENTPPLTPYQKGLLTRAANQAKAAATEPDEAAKKNS